MEKQELKKQLEEQIILLKGQCKDAHYFDTLIDKILSLKGQIDVEPMLLYFQSTPNDKIVQNKNFRIIRNETGSCVQIDGSGLVLDADNNKCTIYFKHLFEKMDIMFKSVFDKKEAIDNGDTSEKAMTEYCLWLDATIDMISAPILASANGKDTLLLVQMKHYMIDRYNQMFEEASKQDVVIESGSDLVDFRDKIDFIEELKDSSKSTES
jgi:hypothetical protein